MKYVVIVPDAHKGSEFEVIPMGFETLPLACAHAAGLARWFRLHFDAPRRLAIQTEGVIVRELTVKELNALDYLGQDYA